MGFVFVRKAREGGGRHRLTCTLYCVVTISTSVGLYLLLDILQRKDVCSYQDMVSLALEN